MGVWRGGIMCPRSPLSSQMEMYLNPGPRVSTLTHHTLLPHLPSPFMVGGEKREERPLRLTVKPSTGMKTGNVLPSSLASIVCRERNVVRSVCEWASVWCGVGSAGSRRPGSSVKCRSSFVKGATFWDEFWDTKATMNATFIIHKGSTNHCLIKKIKDYWLFKPRACCKHTAWKYLPLSSLLLHSPVIWSLNSNTRLNAQWEGWPSST